MLLVDHATRSDTSRAPRRRPTSDSVAFFVEARLEKPIDGATAQAVRSYDMVARQPRGPELRGGLPGVREVPRQGREATAAAPFTEEYHEFLHKETNVKYDERHVWD